MVSLESSFSYDVASSLIYGEEKEDCSNSYKGCRVEVESDSET